MVSVCPSVRPSPWHTRYEQFPNIFSAFGNVSLLKWMVCTLSTTDYIEPSLFLDEPRDACGSLAEVC